MAFTVELTIRGLCAFVPSEPIRFGEQQIINNLKILVLDARQPDVVSNRATPPSDLEICAHLPLLRYSRPGPNMPRGFRLLDGHRIEIAGVDTDQPLELTPSVGNGAQMKKVVALDQPQSQTNPAPALVDPKFLTPLPAVGLVAIMDLEAGLVETMGSVGNWSFQPPPVPPRPTYQSNFTAEALVRIPIAGEQAVLRTINQGGVVDFEQVLMPKGNGQIVDVLLSNLCLEDDQPRRQIEGDFAVFYKLLPNYQGVLRVPHLQNQGPQGGTVQGGANNSPSCAVGFMG